MPALPYPWFQSVVHQLQACAKQDKFPQSLILSGVRGLGKTDFARWLAQALECQNYHSTRKLAPCGHCHHCELIAADSHPDINWCEREEGSQVIKVDQVRALIEKSVASPQVGHFNVLIVDPASAMNINAANALLKSLEEPGSSTLFILLDDQVGPLLPTIRSRCQIFQVPLPPRTVTMEWLRTRIDAPRADDELDNVIALANGSPQEAERLLVDGGLEIQTKLTEFLASALKRQISVVDFAEGFSKFREIALTDFLGWQILWLEAMIRYCLSGTPLDHIPGARMFAYLADKNPPESLFHLRDELLALRGDLLHGATLNKTLVLESTVVRWKQLMNRAK